MSSFYRIVVPLMNLKHLPDAKLIKLNLLPDFQAIHHLGPLYLTYYFPWLFRQHPSPHQLSCPLPFIYPINSCPSPSLLSVSLPGTLLSPLLVHFLSILPGLGQPGTFSTQSSSASPALGGFPLL